MNTLIGRELIDTHYIDRRKRMTSAEMLEFQVMTNFWGRLCNLTDSELMTRRQMEIEQQGNLKRVNDELNRRCKE